MSNVLHVMQVDSSAEDWQEFIRQVTACLKFIERFINPYLKADIIKTTLPRGQWVSVLQPRSMSELPVRFLTPRLTFTVQVSEEVLKENSRHPGGEQNLHG